MSENLSISKTKPTTILTGFLGSGKTTYLNYLINESGDTRLAIVENEYGEESIDNELILRAEDDVIELNNGCLCCTLNDNLFDILNTLYERRDEYDELIIEATGMADPRGLAAPFLTNPSVKKQYPLKAIICLIDAELIEDQIADTEEAIHQISFSDVLLINKADLVSPTYIDSLSRTLREINPLAKIVIRKEGIFPNVDYDRNTLKDSIEDSELGSDISEDVGIEFPVSKSGTHHHHHHTDVVSHTFTFDRPFDFRKLHIRLLGYLNFQSIGLYRMKGLIWIDNSDDVHLIQSVGKRLAMDTPKKWKDGEARKSKIIMIGKNLKRDGLEKMFSQCI